MLIDIDIHTALINQIPSLDKCEIHFLTYKTYMENFLATIGHRFAVTDIPIIWSKGEIECW